MYNYKDEEYFRHVRVGIITALNNKKFNKVLELGAGGCDTIAYMKAHELAKEVTGLELFKIEGSNQTNPLVDKFIQADVANLEQLNLPQNYYDLIICGDILEHVFDPWSVAAAARKLLTDDGILICSIPNIRFFKTMKKIFLDGDFKYEKEGILDLTHIRFFAKKNILELFNRAGYKLVSIEPSYQHTATEKKRKVINAFTLGLFKDVLAFQYFIVVKK